MALLDVGPAALGFAYTSIQAAINAAPDGGHVRANGGTPGNAYAEALTVNAKRIRLFGNNAPDGTGPFISLTGAGGGAAPTLQVINNGGVDMENFICSNVGSAATVVITGLVAFDYFRRLIIDGGNNKDCLCAQFADTILLKNGLRAVYPSCPGQVLFQHFSAVNMATSGINGNAPATGTVFRACLGYNCNGQAFVNGAATYSAWNFSDDATPVGPGGAGYLSLAEMDFVNYAGGNFYLKPTSIAYTQGVPLFCTDITGRLRLRSALNQRCYAGCHDPFGSPPTWLTGTSSIRGL